MEIKKSTIIKLAVLVVVILAFVFIKPLNEGLKSMLAAFENIDSVAEYIRSFGAWAVAISFLMMILQAIAAPIPAFFITVSNAMIWGWGWGSLLSWSSAMAGAAVCFWIARIYGREITQKFVSKTSLENVDEFFIKYGKKAILVARLLPFVPFDPISYAAGLTGMGFWGFFLATGIGQLPATLVYSYAASKMTQPSGLVKGLLLMFGIFGLVYLIKIIYTEVTKNKTKKGANAVASEETETLTSDDN